MPGGTAYRTLTQMASMRIPGLRIAGKTGTAQKQTPAGIINFAWFICFSPVENPQIAIAVMVEGDTPCEETGGGRYAVPVAQAILKTWWQKQQRASGTRLRLPLPPPSRPRGIKHGWDDVPAYSSGTVIPRFERTR